MRQQSEGEEGVCGKCKARKNNVLWRLIYERFTSIAEFCKEYKIVKKFQDVRNLLRLKRKPTNQSGEYRPICKMLAEIAGKHVTEVFPEELYEGVMPKKVREISGEYLETLETARARTLFAPIEEFDPFELACKNEKIQYLERALSRLTKKQKKVIVARYGLNGERPLTCVEAAKQFSISKQGVSAIESYTLPRLRTVISSLILQDQYKMSFAK